MKPRYWHRKRIYGAASEANSQEQASGPEQGIRASSERDHTLRLMTDIHLSPSGPPETVLEPEPSDALEALRAALAAPPESRRDAVADVAARWPR